MDDSIVPPHVDTDMLQINSPSTFNYETTANTTLDITLRTNDNKPLAGILVNILDKSSEENGTILYTALTNAEGRIDSKIKLPSYMTKVVVDASYIGVLRNAVVKIENNIVSATLGGSTAYTGNVEESVSVALPGNERFQHRDPTGATYNYLGTYSTSGKPDYLETPNDVISSALLANINASLPEGKPVPTYHPTYLTGSSATNINLVALADVWITFVHEGAGYQNTLAYFTYPTNNPPASVNDISTLNIILPNASLSGSGGALVSGNKVRIGRFAANTSIGFCLIANGWSDQSKVVGNGLNKFYSIDALNPEPAASDKRHTVLLKDTENKLFLVGFEDQRRDGNSDNDFNDLIFSVSSNPYNAIATDNVNPVDHPGDSDGDGVTDVYDQFPNDPARAYVTYYPGANKFTSTAFEDTWPNTGDYDLNDVIVDQRYKIVNNGQNKTLEIFADYVLRASGGSFHNGFGVQFPFAPSVVSSVTGSKVSANNNVVTVASNGCETGQSKAVIIPFEDFYSVMPPVQENYINTIPAAPFITPDSIHMKISFSTLLTSAQLGLAPFNPFIIANKVRGNEVHLPGEKPTDKANVSLFNTVKDNTIPSLNRYYKTAANLPFAIAIPETLDYPIEGKAISTVYLKFVEWAQSGGTLYPNWYKDSSGYRSPNYFYNR
jgi:LruC domain-containing protein